MIEQIKLEIAAAVLLGAMAIAFGSGWAINGWRLGDRIAHVERERDLAIGQGRVLAAATEACTKGVENTRTSSQAALAQGQRLLEQAKRIGAPAEKQAARIEEILGRQAPPGAGCEDAWKEIEKAGAP